MKEISRVALFGKLNSLAYRGIESATIFCKMRGNRASDSVMSRASWPGFSSNPCTIRCKSESVTWRI